MFYQLIRGSTDQTNKYDTFYLQQRQKDGWTYADVKVNHPLDYERIKEYNLTIRVEVSEKPIDFLFSFWWGLRFLLGVVLRCLTWKKWAGRRSAERWEGKRE